MLPFALTLLVSAAPATCEELWPRVWKALEAQEFKKGDPPLKRRFPDLEKRLGPFWVDECRRFSEKTLDCARGVELERNLAQLRQQLEAEKIPKKDLDEAIERLRAEWSILECRDVDRSLDRAAAVLAKDAGL